jgi:dTDP-4-amino-4,6-dideoxy-D-galactose acyltransferase
MAGLIEPLAWDSEFFGIPIARADFTGATPETLRDTEVEARAAGIACLYGSLDPTDGAAAHLVQTFGHRLVEVALTFERPPMPFTPKPSPTKVRRGTLDDLPALEPAIKTLAPWSRFAADPRFGPDAAGRMHEAWMERAAHNDTDERALYIAYDDDGISGVATFVRAPVPRVDTKGVTKLGTGAADALMVALFDWAGGGATEAGPCAARNIAPLRYLERCGFRVCRTRYLFHRWLDEEPGGAA